MTETSGILAEIVARKRVDVAARLGGFGLEAAAYPSLLRPRGSARARFIMEEAGLPSGVASVPWPTPRPRRAIARRRRDHRIVPTPLFRGSLRICAGSARFLGPILPRTSSSILGRSPKPSSRRRLGCGLLAVSRRSAAAVMAAARRLVMDSLVETHDAESGPVRRWAPRSSASTTATRYFEGRPRTTERLPPLSLRGFVVAASGIRRADVERLAPFAALPGRSSLLRSDVSASGPGARFRTVEGLRTRLPRRGDGGGHGARMPACMVPNTPRAVPAAAEAIRKLADPARRVYRNEKRADRLRRTSLGLRASAPRRGGPAYIRALRNCSRRDRDLGGRPPSSRGSAARRGSARTLFDSQT